MSSFRDCEETRGREQGRERDARRGARVAPEKFQYTSCGEDDPRERRENVADINLEKQEVPSWRREGIRKWETMRSRIFTSARGPLANNARQPLSRASFLPLKMKYRTVARSRTFSLSLFLSRELDAGFRELSRQHALILLKIFNV